MDKERINRYFYLRDLNVPVNKAEKSSLQNELIEYLLSMTIKYIKYRYKAFSAEASGVNIYFDEFYDAGVDALLECIEKYNPEINDNFMNYFRWILSLRLKGIYIKISAKNHMEIPVFENDENEEDPILKIPGDLMTDDSSIPGTIVLTAECLRIFIGIQTRQTNTVIYFCLLFTLDTSDTVRIDGKALKNVIYYENVVFPLLDTEYLRYLFIDECRHIKDIALAELNEGVFLNQQSLAAYKGTSPEYVTKMRNQYYGYLKSVKSIFEV